MPKLKTVTFDHAPKIPGIRPGDLSTIDCDNPPSTLKDWKIVLRGGSMYLISPPGWSNREENRATKRDPKGPSVVHEIPRTGVYLQWITTGADDLDALFKNGGKYESEPLGFKPVPVEEDKPILSQIPPGQMGDA
jgi:hypothetical protein